MKGIQGSTCQCRVFCAGDGWAWTATGSGCRYARVCQPASGPSSEPAQKIATLGLVGLGRWRWRWLSGPTGRARERAKVRPNSTYPHNTDSDRSQVRPNKEGKQEPLLVIFPLSSLFPSSLAPVNRCLAALLFFDRRGFVKAEREGRETEGAGRQSGRVWVRCGAVLGWAGLLLVTTRREASDPRAWPPPPFFKTRQSRFALFFRALQISQAEGGKERKNVRNCSQMKRHFGG